MSDLKEYNDHFKRFYDEFFLFKKKKHQKCPGCSSKKRFIFNHGKLTYACGPKTDGKKCGPQFTIELPKYVDYNTAETQLLNIINGKRDHTDPMSHDLKSLSKLIEDIDPKQQQDEVQEATEELQKLREQFIKDNHLSKRNDIIQELSKQRSKNSYQKALNMHKLLSESTSAEEKHAARVAYAQIIHNERTEILPLIKELREPITSVLMISEPVIIKHT